MKKILALLLSVLMLVGVMPMSVFAVAFDEAATGDYYNIISKNDYVLCDGVTESEIVVNNDDGTRRQVLHVMEVDPNNTNVEVLPSYYQIDKDLTDASNWSAQIMEKQMDYYRDELGYNVVGGMNTALAYDNEAPYGVMVYNGKVLADGTVHKGAQTYLAVIKNDDGTVKFELRSVSEGLKGDEWQAVSANFGFAIKDGKLVTSTVGRSDAADRSMIGIKADGTLVICQAEGRNAPYAVGLSSYEIGEAMLALGCVWAVNGDGGGSSQFLSKREGESDYSLRNIPSDGTPRATINGIIIASKAKPTGEFDHVSMIAKAPYITPGSSVEIEVKGVDASGSAAKLPETGLTYQVSGGSYANGVYTADTSIGEKTITAYYNGEAVGSVTVDVVIPTSMEFINSAMTIPYGKEGVDLGLVAYYGNFEVPLEVKDITFTLSNPSIGSISGFGFNSVPEGTPLESESSAIVAKLVYDTKITANAVLALGKGSEILYSFEDQLLHGFYRGTSANYNYNNPAGVTSIVDATTGKVHNGNYSMAVEVDFSNSLEAGFQLGCLITGEKIVLENAIRIGMWIYVPDEAYGLRIDSGIPGLGGYWEIAGAGEATMTEVGFVYGFDESGWYYISKDISTVAFLEIPEKTQLLKLYISQKDGKNEYYYGDQATVNGKYTFYVDDITVDYSSAVDDREAPIFSDLSYAVPGMDESVSLMKDTSAGYQSVTVNSNQLSFNATVAENTAKNNYTGIDVSSGKAFVDGVDYTDKLTWAGNSRMSLDVTLSEGRHEIKFSVCDKQGNYSSIIREIIVDSSEEDAPVKVVPHDAAADRLLLGSLYYIDVVVKDVEQVKSVAVTLDLNNVSTWHLDHMEIAEGFSASYMLLPGENIAEILIQKTGNVTATGETALISIPTRTWELAPTVAIYGHAGKVWMYPDYKKGNEILPMDLTVEVDAGLVTYIDGTTDSFASPKIQVYTELSGNAYTSSGSAANNYIRNEAWYADWNAGHDHRVETAQYYAAGATNPVTPVALQDKAATCTEAGYIGRTYCETCKSVVDWGTTVPATGHNYVMKDGKLVCECGDESKATGLYEADGNVYYSLNGKFVSGWHTIDGDWYYFDPATLAGADGELELITSIVYTFDQGKLRSGVWGKTLHGTRYYYGPSFYEDRAGWRTIDGKDYFFEEGYRVEGGYQGVLENNIHPNWYYFEEDGSCDRSKVIPDGFYTDRNGYSYVKDGTALTGLQLVDDTYYFFDNLGYAMKGDCAGYLFGDDYRAVSGLISKNNNFYYYWNGKPKMAGLVEVDGAYYFAKDGNGLCVTGKYYVWNGNGILPEGNYEFGEDGKMLDGIVERDGKYYYYENGKPKMAGLVEVDGAYYFAKNADGLCVTGKYYVWMGNGILPEENYEFGADGKMLDGIVERDGKYYYYENGKPKMAGLVEVDGAYYFAKNADGLCVTGKYYVWMGNGILPEGNYEFGADGKMLDGFVNREDGIYYYENGRIGRVGLNYIDGYYYFISPDGKLIVDQTYYVWEPNGYTICRNYTFDSLGRVVL